MHVVHHQRRTDALGSDLALERHVAGVEATHEAQGEQSLTDRHFGVEDTLRGFDRRGEWLFAQRGFADRETREGLLGMQPVRGCDDDRADVVGVDQVRERRCRPASSSLASAVAAG